MSKRPTANNEKGFTIVELLYSMAIFSIILLAASASIIQVGRMYFKGVISSKTQNSARQIIDDISRPIQFSGQEPRFSTSPISMGGGVTANSFCIGNDRYTYAIDAQVDNSVSFDAARRKIRHGLWQDKMTSIGSCPALDMRLADPSTTAGALGDTSQPRRELLLENSRLTRLSVDLRPTIPTSTYAVNIGILYGDEDVLECDNGAGVYVACTAPGANRATASCRGGFSIISSQFCAQSRLNTVVIRRLR